MQVDEKDLDVINDLCELQTTYEELFNEIINNTYEKSNYLGFLKEFETKGKLLKKSNNKELKKLGKAVTELNREFKNTKKLTPLQHRKLTKKNHKFERALEKALFLLKKEGERLKDEL